MSISSCDDREWDTIVNVWQRTAEFFGLKRNLVVLLVATFVIGIGEELWMRRAEISPGPQHAASGRELGGIMALSSRAAQTARDLPDAHKLLKQETAMFVSARFVDRESGFVCVFLCDCEVPRRLRGSG